MIRVNSAQGLRGSLSIFSLSLQIRVVACKELLGQFEK